MKREKIEVEYRNGHDKIERQRIPARKGKRGRPPGSRNIESLISREKMADKLGLLPHEFLALVASGQTITVKRFGSEGWYTETWNPNPRQQIEAAIAAAPYFQPKLVSQKVDHGPMLLQLDQSKLAHLPEHMLQALELLVNSLMTNHQLPRIEAPKQEVEHGQDEDLFN